MGSLLGFTSPAIANPSRQKVEIGEKTNWRSVLPSNKTTDSLLIKGIVLDDDNLPLPGVNVFLKGTKTGTQTNFEGMFTISIAQDQLEKENYLIFSFVGFESHEYRFYEYNKFLNITLTPDNTILGEFIIVRERNLIEKAGSFFANLFSRNSCE